MLSLVSPVAKLLYAAVCVLVAMLVVEALVREGLGRWVGVGNPLELIGGMREV